MVGGHILRWQLLEWPHGKPASQRADARETLVFRGADGHLLVQRIMRVVLPVVLAAAAGAGHERRAGPVAVGGAYRGQTARLPDTPVRRRSVWRLAPADRNLPPRQGRRACFWYGGITGDEHADCQMGFTGRLPPSNH